MIGRGRTPLFLAEASYRRRRLHDASRMVPVLGAVLFLGPLLLGPGGGGTRGVLIYLFVVWLALVVAAAVVARQIGRDRDRARQPGEGADDRAG